MKRGKILRENSPRLGQARSKLEDAQELLNEVQSKFETLTEDAMEVAEAIEFDVDYYKEIIIATNTMINLELNQMEGRGLEILEHWRDEHGTWLYFGDDKCLAERVEKETMILREEIKSELKERI